MGLTWTGDPKPNGEHPVVALIAVAAILIAILLITWARLEIHGTADLEAALIEPGAGNAPPEPVRTQQEREVDEAVTSSRFATGFSP